MKWRRQLRYFLLRFLRLRDMPAKAALGFAVGACVNMYPAFGISVGVAAFLAGLVRANLVAGLLGNVMVKPLWPVMFYLNLWVGNLLIGHAGANTTRTFHGLIKMNWKAWMLVGKVFFLGAIVNTLILGTLLYIGVYWIFSSYRKQMLRFILTQKFI